VPCGHLRILPAHTAYLAWGPEDPHYGHSPSFSHMGAKCLWLAHCRAWPSASAQTPLRMQLPPKVGCQHIFEKLEITGKKLVFIKNYITYDNNFIFYK
jgi:hypothetical protein